MPKTFYVRSKLLASLTPHQRKLYQIALHRFLEGGNGSHLEKLQNSSFYSVRVNQKVRLFLSRVHREGAGYWLWVDVMEDHHYERALRNTNHWLNCQQDQIQECCFDIEMSQDDVFDEELVKIQEACIQLRNQGFILLDSHQQQIKPSALPLIVTGPPGAGKTCLAPSLLLQYIDQSFTQETQHLVYLAQSNALVTSMRTEWLAHAELNQVDINRFAVHFMTMNDLYHHSQANLIGDNTAQPLLVSEDHFYNWLSLQKKAWENVDWVYQECRTMSGYSQFIDYFSHVTSTYSLFSSEEERREIWGIYQSYLGHLKKKECIHLPFYAIKLPCLFDFMVVDEAQDTSRMQLRALAHMVKGQRICYLVGDHQRLVGSESTVPFLKSIFFDTGSTASHESLQSSYRCSLRVVELANAILQLKYRAIGGSLVLDKNELLYVTASLPDIVGNVHWLEEEKALEPLECDNDNAQFAVITTPEFKNEAQKRFGAERVFTVEQIKGLEYWHILLYRVFEQDQFKAINKIIGNDFILYKKASEQKIEKHSEGSICHNTAFNELFVSVTRAKLSVSIYQPEYSMSRNLCKALKVFCNSSPSVVHSQNIADHSTVAEWTLRADQLREQGLEQHALAVEQRVKCKKQVVLVSETVSPTLVTKKTKKMPLTIVAKPSELHRQLKIFYQRILKKDTSVIKSILNHAHVETLLCKILLSSVDTSWPESTLYGALIINHEQIFSKAVNNLPPKHVIKKVWCEAFIHTDLNTKTPDFKKIKAALVSVDINKVNTNELTLLYIASHRGHLKVLQELLKQRGIDINKTDKNGFTPLYIATQNNHVEVVKELLKQEGIEANRVGGNGFSPLHVAICSGDLEMVQTLLQYKIIDINQADFDGLTPLYLAVRNNHFEVVQALLQHEGIQIDKVDVRGLTPLHVASKNGYLKMVQVLLKQKGININKTSINRQTPLCIAAKKGHLEIVQELLKQEGVVIYNADEEQYTPLYIAAEKGHFDVVETLLEQKERYINERNVYKSTPIFIAAAKGYLKIVNKLLEQEGIKINKTDEDGFTPLFIASKNSHFKVVQALLKRKEININKTNDNGVSPLSIAAKKGHIKVVQELLKQDEIEINLDDNEGFTPLYHAAAKGHFEVVQELLKQKGIDINRASNDGLTPLCIAAAYGELKTVQLLLQQKGIDINRSGEDEIYPLYIAAEKGHLEVVQELLKQKEIEMNKTGIDGLTPLCVAVLYGHLNIVLELITQEGIDINQADEDWLTPLYTAAQNNYLEIVQVLLTQRGIDINQMNIDGFSPLYIAAKNGHFEIVDVLLKQIEIEINQPSYHYGTALFAAAHEGHIECVEALIIAGADTQIPITLTEKRLIKEFQCDDQINHLLRQFAVEYKKNNPESYSPSLFCAENANITIKPIEIAEIMGHGDIVQLLRVVTNNSNENVFHLI